MHDEDDIPIDSNCIKPGVQIALMIDEAVGAVRGSAGIAHADVVRRKTPPEWQQVGDYVSPQI